MRKFILHILVFGTVALGVLLVITEEITRSTLFKWVALLIIFSMLKLAWWLFIWAGQKYTRRFG